MPLLNNHTQNLTIKNELLDNVVDELTKNAIEQAILESDSSPIIEGERKFYFHNYEIAEPEIIKRYCLSLFNLMGKDEYDKLVSILIGYAKTISQEINKLYISELHNSDIIFQRSSKFKKTLSNILKHVYDNMIIKCSDFNIKFDIDEESYKNHIERYISLLTSRSTKEKYEGFGIDDCYFFMISCGLLSTMYFAHMLHCRRERVRKERSLNNTFNLNLDLELTLKYDSNGLDTRDLIRRRDPIYMRNIHTGKYEHILDRRDKSRDNYVAFDKSKDSIPSHNDFINHDKYYDILYQNDANLDPDNFPLWANKKHNVIFGIHDNPALYDKSYYNWDQFPLTSCKNIMIENDLHKIPGEYRIFCRFQENIEDKMKNLREKELQQLDQFYENQDQSPSYPERRFYIGNYNITNKLEKSFIAVLFVLTGKEKYNELSKLICNTAKEINKTLGDLDEFFLVSDKKQRYVKRERSLHTISEQCLNLEKEMKKLNINLSFEIEKDANIILNYIEWTRFKSKPVSDIRINYASAVSGIINLLYNAYIRQGYIFIKPSKIPSLTKNKFYNNDDPILKDSRFYYSSSDEYESE